MERTFRSVYKRGVSRPKSPDYEAKSEAILRSAAKLFAERSYAATSMRDLSAEAGVSLAGIYHYFPGKADILLRLEMDAFEQVSLGLEVRLNRCNTPRESLRAVIDNHLHYFAENRTEMRVLAHEADTLGGERGAAVRALKDRYVARVREVLEGLPHGENGVTFATYCLFGMMNWMHTWFDPTGQRSIEDLADTMTRLFLDGFTQQG